VDHHRIVPRVESKDRGFPTDPTDQAEKRPDGGGLARAVRTEEAMHLALSNLQVEPAERVEPAVRFHQSTSDDHVGCAGVHESTI
jgi:hypothetical protein